MHGEIRVKSIPGKGSTFSVELPFGRHGETQPKWKRYTTHLHDLRVLVVDDNPSAQQVLREMLESFSCQVSIVSSAQEAFVALERQSLQNVHGYDVVLLDWNMPGMNGIETAKQIKNQSKLTKLPTLIMVTAFGREELMHEAEQAGISGFLTKPVSPSLLFDTIAQTLGVEPGGSLWRNPYQGTGKNHFQPLLGNVLVVEDNPINQQLAQELLTGFGLSVHMAGNGHQALQMLEAIPVDLVLMDIQMPDMDGFQVTSRIRQDDRFCNLPIIAMTAHTMADDRKRCLAAGMNDHLGKPIDPGALYKKLRKWLKSPSQTNRAIALPKTHLAQTEPSLPKQVAGLDLDEALKRVSGNTGLLLKLLTEFYERHHHALELLEQCLRQADRDTARREVHTIQGVAGNLGAHDLEASAQALEAAIKTAKPQDISQLLNGFRQNFDPVFNSLKVVAEQYPLSPSLDLQTATTPKPMDLLEIAPLFAQLTKLLTEGDTDALSALHQIQDKWADQRQYPIFQQIEYQVQNYDFEGAKNKLATLTSGLDIALKEDTPHDSNKA